MFGATLTDTENEFIAKVRAYPKAELHVHLEAAVPASIYEGWNRGRYETMPANRAPFDSLESFVAGWMDNSSLIHCATQFRELAYAFVKSRCEQNIVYSEAHCSPLDVSFVRSLFPKWGIALDYTEVLLNTLLGLQDGFVAYPTVDVRLIVDMLWPVHVQSKFEHLEFLKVVLERPENQSPHGGKLIIGVGLGGSQRADLVSSFVPFFDAVRSLGLKIDLHCGETGAKNDMVTIIQTINPDRIAHGIAADLQGVSIRDIGYEGHICACPMSNFLTGAFQGRLRDHPINHWLKCGISFSIHSDDPLLFQTDLAGEFLHIQRALGWDFNVFLQLQAAAFEAAFVTHQP